jgi:hypothetical protein
VALRQDDAEFRSTASRTLGYFSLQSADVPSRNPVAGNIAVYSPLVALNRWPAATSAHEQTHYRLTHSTPFGLFYRMVSMRTLRPTNALESVIVDAQWIAQEAASTYLGLASIESTRDLDEAIGELPSELLRQPPYREAFDFLDAILPLASARDAGTRNSYIILAEALATWALSGDVLQRFRTPAELTEADLRQYLDLHAPNRRFLAMIDVLRTGHDLPGILRDLREMIATVQEAVGGFPDDQFWALVVRLQKLVPLESNTEIENRTVVMGQFHRAWSSMSEEKARAEWLDDTPIRGGSFDDVLPEVILDLGQAFGITQGEVDRKRALFLAVVVHHRESEVVFRPTVYRVDDDGVNPVVGDEALFFVMQYSGPIHKCTTAAFARLVVSLPLPIGAVSFLGHSWTHWQVRNAEPDVPLLANTLGRDRGTELGDAVRICVEADLSEPHLSMLMAGAGLHGGADALIFAYANHQFVACLMPKEADGVYLLQLLSGTFALDLFDKIATRNHIRVVAAETSVARHHLPLLQFVGKLLLVEAVASTDSGGLVR